MYRWISLCVLLLLGTSAAAQPVDGARMIEGEIQIRNVRVLTMTEAGDCERCTVVVQAGRIIAVVPDIEPAPASPRAYIIDGRGATLLPGLADMHVHYRKARDGVLYIANGVTTVRNMWGTLTQTRLDAQAKAGALVGPNVHSPGPIIDGAPPVNRFSMSAATPDEVRIVVESQYAAGFGAIKLYENLDPATYAAAVATARRLDMQVWTHVPASMTIEDVLDLEVDSIERCPNFTGRPLRR